jgi:hypothetical protein
LTDLEELGDLVADIEWDDSQEDRVESEDGDLLDSEIDSNDEDEPFLEGWDTDPLAIPEAPILADGKGERSDDDLEMVPMWRFMVKDGECRFERPTWLRWRPTSKSGKDAIEDLERRMQMMERIASWLTEHRRDFLLNPDPWLLGGSALSEFEEGHPSVVPGHFLVVAQVSELCQESLFSRYRRASLLEWENATLPLDFLFGPEARIAWVANVVVQAASRAQKPLEELLKDHMRATKSKGRAKRDELASKKARFLDWPQVIARATDLAGAKWTEVLQNHGTRMLASQFNYHDC